MTGPEAITEAELADYLESVNGQRRDRALDLAAGALEYARRNREPEYEPGAVYRDPEGRLYLRTAAAGWLWLDPVDTARAVADAGLENTRRDAQPFALRSHLPAILDALRIAVASGGYEYGRGRYRAALEALEALGALEGETP